jgi:hypothetical protein
MYGSFEKVKGNSAGSYLLFFDRIRREAFMLLSGTVRDSEAAFLD